MSAMYLTKSYRAAVGLHLRAKFFIFTLKFFVLEGHLHACFGGKCSHPRHSTLLFAHGELQKHYSHKDIASDVNSEQLETVHVLNGELKSSLASDRRTQYKRDFFRRIRFIQV